MRTSFWFQTKEEAEAFIEGVNYANDSALEVLGIYPNNTPTAGYTVEIEDEEGK